MVCDLFNVALNWFHQYFIEEFYIDVLQREWPAFLLFFCNIFGFVIRLMLSNNMSLGAFFPPHFFRIFEKTRDNLWSHMVQVFCLLIVFSAALISLAVIFYYYFFQIFSFFLFNLGRLYFSRNFSVSPWLSTLLHIIFISYYFYIILFLYNLLHLCGTSFHFSFISNIFYLKLLFLWWFWANFHQLCLYFQRPCSWFYWSFLLFLFTLYFVYLHCDLYYFLHFTDFGFCLLFFF